jgi:hypothetical protein
MGLLEETVMRYSIQYNIEHNGSIYYFDYSLPEETVDKPSNKTIETKKKHPRWAPDRPLPCTATIRYNGQEMFIAKGTNGQEAIQRLHSFFRKFKLEAL